jgi:serine/threonine protein kinase
MDCLALQYRTRLGRNLTEEEAVLIMLEVAKGVAHLHSKGLIYQDMKLANILATWDDSGRWTSVKVCNLA